MNHRWLQFHLAIYALLMLAAPALAQTKQASQRELRELRARVEELERKLDALEASSRQKDQSVQATDQQVRILDRRLDVQEEAQRETQRMIPEVQANSSGFWLDSQDGSYKLHVGGYIQADSRFYTAEAPGATSTFIMRRVRPFFEGTVAEYYDFRLMVDFGQGATTLQDAYADVHYFGDTLRLQLGKLREPVGLERLQQDRHILFVERAMTQDLEPDRDLGGQLHGRLWNDLVEYQAGIFNGSTDNVATTDLATHDAKDVAARLFFHPFVSSSSEALQGLGVGISGTYGSSERGLALDALKSPAQNIFFSYNKGAVAAGYRARYSPQFYYHDGSFGLLGEYVWNSQKVGIPETIDTCPPFGCNKTVTKTRPINNYAWQIAPSYVLTGENASYQGVRPLHAFDPRAGTWGRSKLPHARTNWWSITTCIPRAWRVRLAPPSRPSNGRSASTGT